LPIISCAVPWILGSNVLALQAQVQKQNDVRREVRKALDYLGIPELQVTIEFFPCIFPERLIVRYETRGTLLDKASPDREAEIVGKIVEKNFQVRVECIVAHLERERTGMYLTP